MKVFFAFCIASDVVCPEGGLSHPRIKAVFFPFFQQLWSSLGCDRQLVVIDAFMLCFWNTMDYGI
jgi:hypothetical protein